MSTATQGHGYWTLDSALTLAAAQRPRQHQREPMFHGPRIRSEKVQQPNLRIIQHNHESPTQQPQKKLHTQYQTSC